MRILITNLLAVAALLFSATSASALFFDIEMSVRPGTDNSDLLSLVTSDTVTVDLFFTTDEPGMQQLAVGVISPDTVAYDIASSAALPLIYPAALPSYTLTGAQNGYILYIPTGKAGFNILDAVQPAPVVWPAPAPGTNKTNINFQVPNLLVPTQQTNAPDGEWIASIVFHIGAGFGGGELSLQISGLGSVLRANDIVYSTTNPELISLSAPLVLSGPGGVVPEPTTAALIGLGILGLAVAGRRKN
jgi:hypothetical protein